MAVKRILVNEAEPGMVIAEDIYSANNQLIVSAGSALNDHYIARMRFYRIKDLKIKYGNDDEDISAEKITDSDGVELKSMLISEKSPLTKEYRDFSRIFDAAVSDYKRLLSRYIDGTDDISSDKLAKSISSTIAKCTCPSHLLDLINSMRNHNDVVYAHSINVALISYILGCWLKFPKSELSLLIEAGLLHDIGKLRIPQEILSKPTALTPEEKSSVRNHTFWGYELIKDRPLNLRVKMAVQMHHERCDGSGYPKGMRGTQLDSLTKVLAIADVYDAMTSPRPYRSAVCPWETIRWFEEEGMGKFDTKYLLTFLQGLAQNYINVPVRLSNDEIGRVVLVNSGRISCPVVYTGSKFYDLADNGCNLRITEVIYP